MTRTKRPLGRPPQQTKPPSDAVRRVRLALGMTQAKMARELQCAESSVRRFEGTQTIPTAHIAAFKRLARKAEIPLEAE